MNKNGLGENHKHHVICHGNAERIKISQMLKCSFDEVHVLHSREDVKKIPGDAVIYNLGKSFDEMVLADFAKKRGNEVHMFSISEQKWIKT